MAWNWFPFFFVFFFTFTSDVWLFGYMVFNATFNNIWVKSWRSVVLVEETGGLREKHRSAASHWQTLSHKRFRYLNCHKNLNIACLTSIQYHKLTTNRITNEDNIGGTSGIYYKTTCSLGNLRVLIMVVFSWLWSINNLTFNIKRAVFQSCSYQEERPPWSCSYGCWNPNRIHGETYSI